jgi:hypothetical protein
MISLTWGVAIQRLAASITLVVAAVLLAFCGMQSAAASAGPVTVSATIDGHAVANAGSGNPIRLSPGKSADVVVELTNHGTEPVKVKQVDFSGSVLGLKFFSFTTPVEATVPPGGTEALRYRVDLTDLNDQATGLIGATLTVKDTAGKPIASIPTVTDVRGSLMSVYGFFGIALLALTGVALADTALALARHRLSTQRWRRGLRLMTPGIGIGLVIAFSASVLRLWVPQTGSWLVTAGVMAAAFFALGYFSPTPESGGGDEFDDDEDEDVDHPFASDLDTEDISAGEFPR